MKKMHIFKALFAATALALALPSCSDIGEESTIQPQAIQAVKEGKIPVSLSVKEEFRTIISAVDTNDLAYTLVITDTADSTAADYEAPKTIELTDLTGTVAYLTPEKTYSFALTGYAKGSDGKVTTTAILATRSPVEKQITAANATVSLVLQAVTDATVHVTLPVTYGTGYGVSDVTATVYNDSALTVAATDTLALDSENAKNTDKTDGEVVFTGTIATGATKWVKIELKDGTKIIGGKTIALYGIPTGDIEAESVEATVKEYKATVNLTADTKPESLTLKNQAVTTAGYTGISVTTESTANPYVFSAYVPVGTYDVYNGETLLGQVATSAAPLTVNTSITLTKITAAWTTSQPTLYVGGEGNEDAIKAALTVTATLSTGDEAVTNYTLNFDNTAAGEQTATISYTYNGKTETATVTLTLTAVELESIAVDESSVLKKEYTVGDELDLTGLVLALTYNDTSKNTTVAYTKPDTESGEAGNVNDFTVTVYSDSECTTPVTGAFSELGVADYYVKVTYAELTTEDAFSVKVAAGSTYILKVDSATISLMKTEFGTISTEAQSGGKAYLTAATDNWNNSTTYTYLDDSISYTGQAYNMSGPARIVTLKASSVAAFRIYARGGENRKYTVTVGDTLLGTQTLASSNVEKSPLFYTGDTGEVSIKLAGNSGSVYPVCITVYSETAVLNLVKAEFETLKATVADITESQYWRGYNAIVEKRDVDTTGYTTAAQYNAAISDLQSAIAAAVKYVAPTAITVTYADTPVENGAELSFSKASGNTLTLTAKENEGSTGSLTWTIDGIEGISKEVTVAEDGISTCVISGITEIGTINVKVEDTRASLSKAFTITVTANVVKVEADDSVTVTASESSVEVGRSILLTAETEKSYSESVTYNWYKNNTAIDGATTPTYSYSPTVDDVGSVTFKVTVTGSEATATSNTYSVMVTLTDYTELFSKYGTSAGDISIEPTSTVATLANGSFYFDTGAYFTTTNGDNKSGIAKNSVSAETSGWTKTYDYYFRLGERVTDILYLPVVHNCTVTIYWRNGNTSLRGIDIAAANGIFSKHVSSVKKDNSDKALMISDTSSDDKKRIASIVCKDSGSESLTGAETSGYITTTFRYTGSADVLKIINSSVKATATLTKGNGSNYIYAIDVKYSPDPNTTIDVSSGISSDITLTADANVFTVAGDPVTASGSTIAWLVDGTAVDGETAATFTLSGKTVGEWYDVTAKVTDAGGVVYTKTTSVLYTGN